MKAKKNSLEIIKATDATIESYNQDVIELENVKNKFIDFRIRALEENGFYTLEREHKLMLKQLESSIKASQKEINKLIQQKQLIN